MKDIFSIIPAKKFRDTNKVTFHAIPVLEGIKGLDRVEHGPGAYSPCVVGNVERPWYMHPHQVDNLMVFHGTRVVELYTHEHNKIETFEVTPHKIKRDGEVMCEGPAILSWPVNTFHRVHSGDEGSISINFAVRTEGFDIKTEFNIYDIDLKTGKFLVVREGHLDQKEDH